MTDKQARAAHDALKRAAELAGGWKGLAQSISGASAKGVTPQGCYKWSITGVPAERAVEIERLLDGAVLRQELRPDLFSDIREGA